MPRVAVPAPPVAVALRWRRGSRLGRRWRRALGDGSGGVDADPGDVGLEGLPMAVVVATPMGARRGEAADGADGEEGDEELAFHGSCHR
jgi:hypothetical protein